MSEYDCLLLEFVFGQRPDDALKVKSHVLESIAADPELQKAEILFLGSFGRACEFLSAGDAEVGGSFETNPTMSSLSEDLWSQRQVRVRRRRRGEC